MQPTNPKKSTLADTIRDVILLGITLVAIYWLLAPDKARLLYPVSLADLQGVWTTTHPQYQDRFLQFSDATVAFGWGEADAGAYAIDELDSEPAGNSTLVHLRYVDMASTDYQLSFHYVGQNGGTIWMKNQTGVYWIRTNPEPIYNPAFK
ncbi:MAG: hypothetical protein KQI81_14625 [Deltaproteobacteria bacterium]|nr:hypothetical protein [Deltaproteobacteria bacterium]